MSRVEIPSRIARALKKAERVEELTPLPTGVARVRAIALSAGPGSSQSSPRGDKKTSADQRLAAAGWCAETQPQGRKDMILNSRVLLSVTLLFIIWFWSFRGTAQDRPRLTTGAETHPSELASLKQKALSGDAKAEYSLGMSYLSGAGVPQDYRQAATWFRKAAAQGSADAEFGLGYLYEQGKGLRQDYRQAVTHYAAAAQQGHPTAENNLGSLYAHGHGVRKNLAEAVRWYRAAADGGEVTAQCNLATLYFRGSGVTRDYAQAAMWFRAAAERGYAPAQENLAWMYYTGTGVRLDYSEAAAWVKKAAERGYARAQIDLGHLFEQGKGVPLDYVSAYTWYMLAAAGGDERGTARMKSLARAMTRDQISEATVRARQFDESRFPREGRSSSSGIASSSPEWR